MNTMRMFALAVMVVGRTSSAVQLFVEFQTNFGLLEAIAFLSIFILASLIRIKYPTRQILVANFVFIFFAVYEMSKNLQNITELLFYVALLIVGEIVFGVFEENEIKNKVS